MSSVEASLSLRYGSSFRHPAAARECASKAGIGLESPRNLFAMDDERRMKREKDRMTYLTAKRPCFRGDSKPILYIAQPLWRLSKRPLGRAFQNPADAAYKSRAGRTIVPKTQAFRYHRQV